MTRRTNLAFVAAVLFSAAGYTQDRPAPVISPEVHADRTVTFRLRAPNAQAVRLTGEFLKQPAPLEKDEAGVWTAKVGPLEPGMYGYNFLVDEVSHPDPTHTDLKTGVLWFSSVLRVPGDAPLFFDVRKVPHGTVHLHIYPSSSFPGSRRVAVYTPPGYDPAGATRYPVLYLLHGYGDNEMGWHQSGHANLIFDNLIAERKAKPMVVVMPFGHDSAEALRERARASERPGLANAIEVTQKDLFEDVIPLVEATYKVFANRENRAITGLSMGGQQALGVGLNNLDRFAWVAGFSSALFPQMIDRTFSKLLANPEKANEQLNLLWVACGVDDRLIEGNRAFHKALEAKGVEHEFHETPGAHTWTVWRIYLRDVAQKFFQ